MTTATTELAKEIQDAKDAMRALQDETRVRIHLAGMDAKDAWSALEPRVAAVCEAAHEVNEATRVALHKMLRELSMFRSSLN